MKPLAALSQKLEARRERLFWRNFRAARRCQCGFYLVRLAYDPVTLVPILQWRRRLAWRVRGVLELVGVMEVP